MRLLFLKKKIWNILIANYLKPRKPLINRVLYPVLLEYCLFFKGKCLFWHFFMMANQSFLKGVLLLKSMCKSKMKLMSLGV